MGDEIVGASGLPPEKVFDASLLRQAETISTIKALKPDIGLSVFFGYILRRDLLDVFPQGCLNVHPAFLPFNRGAHPNVWSIIEGTPAGVTLHYIDQGVDTGDIITQKKVAIEPIDTGATLYVKLEEESMRLLSEVWPELARGNVTKRPQPAAGGSSHRSKDVDAVDEIHLEKEYKARDLLNILRARTFPPYPGAYFVDQGRKVFLSLDLRYEESRE
jgi:methionyl-tRNA formyltransferase